MKASFFIDRKMNKIRWVDSVRFLTFNFSYCRIQLSSNLWFPFLLLIISIDFHIISFFLYCFSLITYMVDTWRDIFISSCQSLPSQGPLLERLLFLVWLTPSGSLPQITPSWIFPLTWLDLGLDLFSCGRRSLLALDIPNTNLSAKILRYAEILTQVSFKISSKISSKADSVTSFLRVFSYFVKSVKQGDK